METKFAEIPDALWEQVEALLPPIPEGPKRGRPPIPSRTILSGIVYRLRTGAQWKALPSQFGSGSTCHARFQAWSEAGIFRRLFEKLVEFYDEICGIDCKSGVKRHILTDGRGAGYACALTNRE
ncbi:MAG TPA: transposase [Kofleriaceae bacterium]